METIRVAYITNVTSDLLVLGRVAADLSSSWPEIEIIARATDDLFCPEQFQAFAAQARACCLVIAHLMGGKEAFPPLDTLAENLATAGVPFHAQATATELDPDLLALSTVSKEQFRTIATYVNYGGCFNLRSLVLWAANEFCHRTFPVERPQPPSWEGIYYPGLDHIPSLDEYLARHVDAQRPTLGILFYQSFWQSGDTECVDQLIEEIERQGCNPLAVFLHTVADSALGTRGAAAALHSHLFKEGRPVVDALISLLSFSLSMRPPSEKGEFDPEDVLLGLGVPVIKMVETYQTLEEWQENLQGLTVMEVSSAIAMPEFDGMLITVPVAAKESSEVDPLTGARLVRYTPIPERVRKAVSSARKWADLRHTPNAKKRVAIILHNNPPRNDNIGGAFGLDTPVSVCNLLREMQSAGYMLENLPEDGSSLMQDILEHCTNDRRWMTNDQLAERAVARIPAELYRQWFAELPDDTKNKMQAHWGDPPGKVFLHGQDLLVPGVINGNVFIGIQPPRGFLEDPEAIYHSPDLPIPHHYYAYYRWIRDVFRADLVMHIGTHGTLEWLPGKAVGLSASCFPDACISDLPNIYPYIINVPGEGIQAKRRSYCCIIDHLIPVMHNAGAYEESAELLVLIEDYYQAVREDPAKLPALKQMIWEKVSLARLDADLGVTETAAFADFPRFVEQLHTYLQELADTQIRDGLHVFGEPPEGERLDEFLVALTRLANGEVPSLRESLVKAQGYSYDELVSSRGRLLTDGPLAGLSAGEVIKRAHEQSLGLVRSLREEGFEPSAGRRIAASSAASGEEALWSCLDYICASLVPRIRATVQELDNSLAAADGRFVPPGPSGSPTRGMADILPTGRNFYAVDPQAIPTRAAWKTGVSLGDALLERYLSDEGRYPRSVGIVLWATCTMRNRGDDVAEILHLLGVRPVWDPGSGRVKGLEVVPLSELGRPRIDVTVRISGLFRDAFPNLVHLLDQAVEMVASLEQESPDENYVLAHVKQEAEARIASGTDHQTAYREARFRLFGDKPGTYGAGVCDVIDAKNWKDSRDLAQVYVVWGGYAYGRDGYGVPASEVFKQRLAVLDATVKNADSREIDMLDSDDFYSYHGGMIAAVKVFKGEAPRSYAGDSSDPQRVKVRSTAEETKHIFRARILNPKWIDSMKRHGYKGAADLSRMIDYVFGWDATAEVMEDWMYEALAARYPLDEEMQRWLKETNPYALQNMVERLLEAVQRDMWHPSDETEARLRQIYLEVDGMLEDL